MNKQRLLILISAAVGILSIFLPWVSLGPISVSGSSGDGVLLLFILAPVIIISLIGDKSKNLSGAKLFVTLGLGVLALIISIYTMSNLSKMPMGSLGVGLYLSIISSIGVCALPFLIKENK